mgnify:CR=1 FL=1
MIASASWRSIRAAGKAVVAKDLDIRVEGLDHLPDRGPVILAARHYHHLYDGCAVLATVPREVRVLVGLDWIERPIAMRGMQTACRAAGWPVVYRTNGETTRAEWLSNLRNALRESQAILNEGKVLLVFPEGYPTIDPHGSPKAGPDDFLPFEPGLARIARNAWNQGIPAVIVPLGFRYVESDRWQVTLRFGAPIGIEAGEKAEDLTAIVQRQVIALSR